MIFRAVFWVILPCKMIIYNPEDSSEHHTRRRENLKSHIRNELGISPLSEKIIEYRNKWKACLQRRNIPAFHYRHINIHHPENET
jgi:hypothetical protein